MSYFLDCPCCSLGYRSRFHSILLDIEATDPSDLEAVLLHCYSPQLLCHNNLILNICLFVDWVSKLDNHDLGLHRPPYPVAVLAGGLLLSMSAAGKLSCELGVTADVVDCSSD
ncbi:hypothetical protein HAX54_036625 [Datura stramonium]|uniref:Uncharacterized protein n=1 Tax=Datura stramonium TaxID=4076 RepID=A0ABS8VIT3_DATST|nr:hypothetical protein [Datura stramonium]